MTDPRTLASTYFRSWKDKDFHTLRSILAEDVTFRGSLASVDGADGCVEGLEGMSQIVTDIDIRAMCVDGDDVITWFDLHTSVAPPCPTANWSHIVDGKIAAIPVTFDPRKIVAAG